LYDAVVLVRIWIGIEITTQYNEAAFILFGCLLEDSAQCEAQCLGLSEISYLAFCMQGEDDYFPPFGIEHRFDDWP